MSTRYDPQILQEFADKLYSQASSVVVFGIIIGISAGGIFGIMAGSAFGAVLLAIVLGGLGFLLGMSIAVQLKLRAQTVLCQKQIEENTRRPAGHSSSVTLAASIPAPISSSSKTRYYYSTDGEQQGPVEASDLRMMRKDGIITDEILVLREGESQWRFFREYLELNR